MLRDNVIWILVLAETALIERERPTSREQVPKFLLQFLDLLFEIRDEGCLFLESSTSDQVVSAKVAFTRNLGRTRRVHDGGRG